MNKIRGGFRRAACGAAALCLALNAAAVEIENGVLEAVLQLPEGTLSVKDKRTGETWQQYRPVQAAAKTDLTRVTKMKDISKDSLLQVDDPKVVGTTINAMGKWKNLSFPITYVLDGNTLSVTVGFAGREPDLAKRGITRQLMRYPYPFYNEKQGLNAYVPVQEGVIYATKMVDGNRDPIRFKPREAYSKLSMPWWGLSDGTSGVMTRMNTFWDAMFAMEWYDTEYGPRALPSIQWSTSQGRFDYPRTVTYHFIDKGGYVKMAKTYRALIKDTPYFKAWPEKLRENSNVSKLKGAPYIWCENPLSADIVKGFRKAGFKKAILSKTTGPVTEPLEGFGAGAIEEAEKAGYLIGKYHNSGWIREGLINSGQAGMDEVIIDRDGKALLKENKFNHPLGGYYYRCSAVMPTALDKIAAAERKVGLTYFYADTICAEPGQECYSKEHPVLRRDAHLYRRKALDALTGAGFVTSSEKGSWWAASSVHIFHRMESLGAYTGPYFGSGKGDTESGGSYSTDKPGYEQHMLGMQYNPRTRVPLFQLVFHDSVYCSRRRHADPARAPELWDTRDLLDMLYGISALINLNPQLNNAPGQAGWKKYEARYLQMYKNVCGWHGQIGFDEMTGHRFLTPNRNVQETTFSSGKGIVVNFGTRPWKDPRGFTVAPMGFRNH